jgi:hypothetical protein
MHRSGIAGNGEESFALILRDASKLIRTGARMVPVHGELLNWAAKIRCFSVRKNGS